MAYTTTKISTHAPLARCDPNINSTMPRGMISTHAPLARCDTGWTKFPPELIDFNSRTSCEVRRTGRPDDAGRLDISTHAPLARCDPRPRESRSWKPFQLTHLLRGATRALSRPCVSSTYFNSRTSCEVRLDHEYGILNLAISTHAPLARCDTDGRLFTGAHGKFQLTHLLRGATS